VRDVRTWLNQLRERIRRQLLHRETKTESSDAILPLVGICATALGERRKDQTAARDAAGDDWPDLGLVLTTRSGQPIEPRNFNRSFATAAPRRAFARSRYTRRARRAPRVLIATDVHPRVAMQILRHSQISVTMNVYSEVSSDATRKALKRLGKRLDS
jgi:hypothetical protein